MKIHAASVNPVDYKIRLGLLPFRYGFPLVLGYDASGVVEAVGESVTDFKPGDEVFYTSELWDQGTYAEYQVVKAAIVAPKPPELSHVESASLPLAGGTAWRALIERAKVGPNDTVLIHGGAGGVGSLAVQIAKAAKSRVVATAGPDNVDFVRELGADAVIDYQSRDFVEEARRLTDGRGVDAVLDTVGGEVFAKSLEALGSFGRIVTIGRYEGSINAAIPKNVTMHGLFLHRGRDYLEGMSTLLKAGRLKPVVNQVLPFSAEAVQEAHARVETGHGRGKIVLRVVEEGR